MAQDTPSQTLITNLSIFNGKSDKLTEGTSVLVADNKIAKIAKSIKGSQGATVVDGGGRTLMPGLIDAHVHLYRNVSVSLMFTAPKDDLYTLTIIEWLDEYTIPV